MTLSNRAQNIQAEYDAQVARMKSQAERNTKIKLLRDRGWTLDAIGKLHDLTRERVRQIINDPDSHKEKELPPPRLPRAYVKRNGVIPHGTATGYAYGCRESSHPPCPASPTCSELRKEYQRRYDARRRERRAWDNDPF